MVAEQSEHSDPESFGVGSREVEAMFALHADAVTESRHFVREILHSWNVRDLSADAELVTTELLANAIRHANSAAHVCLAWSPPTLCIRVRDQTHAPPVLIETPGEDGGYGLRLIGAIADSFGTDQQRDGKIVWCHLVRRGTAPR
jgi:anti-sigma regulatory factor (Ser/Thr protein kinase)